MVKASKKIIKNPIKSKSQYRLFRWRYPHLFKLWQKEYPVQYSKLPEKVKNQSEELLKMHHNELLRIFNSSLTMTDPGIEPEKEVLRDMLIDAKPIAKEIGATEKFVKDWIKKMKKKIGLKNLQTPPWTLLNELAQQQHKLSYSQLAKADPHSAAAIERLARQQTERRNPDKLQIAENAIRDMFLSQQYNGKVPAKDMAIVLRSKRWAKMYGKKNVTDAWKGIKDGKYVKKVKNNWVWGMWNMNPKYYWRPYLKGFSMPYGEGPFGLDLGYRTKKEAQDYVSRILYADLRREATAKDFKKHGFTFKKVKPKTRRDSTSLKNADSDKFKKGDKVLIGPMVGKPKYHEGRIVMGSKKPYGSVKVYDKYEKRSYMTDKDNVNPWNNKSKKNPLTIHETHLLTLLLRELENMAILNHRLQDMRKGDTNYDKYVDQYIQHQSEFDRLLNNLKESGQWFKLEFKDKHKKNPASQAQVNKAVEIRERFSGEQVGSIRKKKISLPGPGEPLIVLAETPQIRYYSNKEGYGPGQIYYHDFKRNKNGRYPLLCCTIDRKTMLIIGGKFKIDKSFPGGDIMWLID